MLNRAVRQTTEIKLILNQSRRHHGTQLGDKFNLRFRNHATAADAHRARSRLPPSMNTCVPGSLGFKSFTIHVPLVASRVSGVRTVTGTSAESVSNTEIFTGVLPSAG